jgi:hypothetical protein
MVVNCRDEFGVPILCTLVILGGESSLADPDLGGPIVAASNFGCIKYAGRDSAWGRLAEPEPIIIRDVEWYRFRDPATGMRAWATYVRDGAEGAYLPLLTSRGGPDWPAFCAIYYGSKVSGFDEYLMGVTGRYVRFKDRATAAGFNW